MKIKKSYLILIVLVFITGSLILGALYWAGSPFCKIPVRGYIFISKNKPASLNDTIEERIGFTKEFFSISNENWPKKRPLSGTEVGLLGKDSIAITDEKGYFELHERKSNLKGAILAIKVSYPDQIIKCPIQPANSLKKEKEIFQIVNINENGQIEVTYLKEEESKEEKAKVPVLMVHGFGPNLGHFEIPLEKKKWNRIKAMFEQDKELVDYEFFLFEYPDDQDIVQSSREISWAIERLNSLYKRKVALLGFSMGGLLSRHYICSNWYKQGSIERLLLVGTPNHGCNLALFHLDLDWDDGDGEASKQLMVDSDFLKVLNNETSDITLKNKYCINPHLQDYRGLNPEVSCSIIAGEVTEKIREGVRQSEKNLKGLAAELLDFFNDIFKEFMERDLDSDEMLRFFEDSAKKARMTLEEFIDQIPQGDLIVSLESAKIEGVPFVTIPYTHNHLIVPDNTEDIRYVLIKKFILGEKMEKSEQNDLILTSLKKIWYSQKI